MNLTRFRDLERDAFRLRFLRRLRRRFAPLVRLRAAGPPIFILRKKIFLYDPLNYF